MQSSRKCFSIMERYRRIRPIALDQQQASKEYKRPTEGEEKYFNPLRSPSLPWYIRSPVPASAKVFSPSKAALIQPDNPKRLRVALVGAPNAGKTSLLNSLLGKPIGAVSTKVNTTRESIVGVFTEGNCQIEFVDCPGIVPRDGSEEAKELSGEAWMTFNDCDLALLIVDTVKRPNPKFLEIARKISPKRDIVAELENIGETTAVVDKKVILVLNKMDLVDDRKWLKVRNIQISNHAQFHSCFYVSAKEGLNVSKLKAYLKEQALPGNWQYAPDTTSNLSMTGQLEQLIRGVLYTWFHRDVPYKIQQQTVGWTERLDGTLVVEHELIVKDSVVARMVLGTRAKVLQRLREHVVYKLKKLWNMEKLVLLLHVKALDQRTSKRDKIEKSKHEDFNTFISRGSGAAIR